MATQRPPRAATAPASLARWACLAIPLLLVLAGCGPRSRPSEAPPEPEVGPPKKGKGGFKRPSGPPGKGEVPRLLAGLKGGNPLARTGAVKRLGQAGAAAVPGLIESLDDSSPAVRHGAAEALGLIGAPAARAVPRLTDLLADKSELVRTAAATALGRIGPEARPAVSALRKGLGHKDHHFRAACAEALGGVGPGAAEATGNLVKALDDEHYSVRESAARGLGGIGPKAAQALPRLKRAARTDSAERVRLASAEALWRIERSPDAVTALEALLRDSGDSSMRREACEALGRLGPAAAAALPSLKAALEDEEPVVRAAAGEAVPLVEGS
jgi:HEAT repeat protein